MYGSGDSSTFVMSQLSSVCSMLVLTIRVTMFCAGKEQSMWMEFLGNDVIM